MVPRQIQRCLGGLLAIATAGACSMGSSETSESDLTAGKAHLLALSTYSASLGTPIDAYIANPPDATARKFELVFDGTFTRSDGAEEKVTLAQAAIRTEAGAIRWTTFGPFANPFTPNDPDIGIFTGTIGLRVTLADGTETMDDSPLPVRFEVKPSILITELQPIEASCASPALRLIGSLGYKIRATTIGFKATSLELSFRIPGTVPDGNGRPVIDVDPQGKTRYRTTKLALDANAIAKREAKPAFDLPPVPANIPSYGVVFAAVATDDEGRQIASTFGMSAHRPIELFSDGRFQLAQLYAPKPVSACIPGGQQGRTVDYSEAKHEERARSLAITLSKHWLKSDQNNWSTSDGKTISKSTTNEDGYGNGKTTANSFSFSRNHADTTGVSFTASHGTTKGINGGISFGPFGSAGGNMSSHNDQANTNNKESTNGSSQTSSSEQVESSYANHSTATTDANDVTKTDTKGGSTQQGTGGGDSDSNNWTVSSADTIQRGFSGRVIANTYGVLYRQLARYTAKAFVLVYDVCGAGQVVGDVTMQDYIWAPDLALSDACPPLPKTNFPDAQCSLPPCDPR
jgi:hypothetical protein